MKRPKVRLALMLEWIAAIAVGLGTMRWTEGKVDWGILDETRFPSVLLIRGWALLAGIALVECIPVLLNNSRGRRPSSWGLGRWSLAISGLFLMVEAARRTAAWGIKVVQIYHEGGWESVTESCGVDLDIDLALMLGRGLVEQFSVAFIAGLIAIRLARWPGDPAPDAREWSGRVFTVVLLAWTIFDWIGRMWFSLEP